MKTDKPTLEYTILAVVILFAVGVFAQFKYQEINFCRAVFHNLVKGSSAAEKFIDWENFQASGIDVGALYRGLPDEKEKRAYQEAFVKNFSAGFIRSRGELKSFSHWRIYQKRGIEVVVACDYLGYNKTLLFTVSKLGRMKLISLYWESANES